MQKYLLVCLDEVELRFSSNSKISDKGDKIIYYAFSLSSNHSHHKDTQKWISHNIGPLITEEYRNWKKQSTSSPDVARILEMQNSILIDITKQSSDIEEYGGQYCLQIARFENNMLQFKYEVLQLTRQNLQNFIQSKKLLKKKQQMKHNQILTYQVSLLSQNSEILVKDHSMPSVLQHYLIIRDFTVKNQETIKIQRRAQKIDQRKYYAVTTYGNGREPPKEYCMPIQNMLYQNSINDYVVCIQIPDSILFKQYVDGKVIGKSQKYETSKLSNPNLNVQLQGQSNTQIKMNMKWGINIEELAPEQNLVVEAHEILIYDIQVKFDRYTEFSNTKVKIIYGNKAFQLGGEFNIPKPVKVKKFINFKVKSEEEEICIGVQRNLKMIAQSRFYTDELISYSLNYPKRKLIDQSGKNIGYIKFKCEKAKNLSLPHNNKFWKESNKKKYANPILLHISQACAYYAIDQPLQLSVKTDSEQKMISNVPNFEYYDNEFQSSKEQIVISVKPDESVYMLVKPKKQSNNSESDFIGITLLNFSDLLIGQNPLQLPFFKNQSKTITLSFIINKVINYPFIKSTFQPELLASPLMKTISASLFINQIQLTPYLYTFQYLQKTQIYCIIEMNRQKKVLILNPSSHSRLQLVVSISSDSLNFIIEESQYLKIKATIVVTDLGQQSEVYGVVVAKLKASQIISVESNNYLSNQKKVYLNNISIKNPFGLVVGEISMEVYEGIMENSHRKDTHDILDTPRHKYSKQDKQIKQGILKFDHNHTSSENNYQEHYFNNSKNSISHEITKHKKQGTKKKKQAVKLPFIYEVPKPKKKDNLDELMKMMQVRKRGATGRYVDNDSLSISKVNKNRLASISERKSDRILNNSSNLNNSSVLKIQRENPNLNRNLQILFPKKNQRKQEIKKQINIYEEKLEGLKSVLHEITDDIEDIEPTINQQYQYDNRPIQRNNLQEESQKEKLFNSIENVEWEDNQFAMK